jgi:hypothetical protein
MVVVHCSKASRILWFAKAAAGGGNIADRRKSCVPSTDGMGDDSVYEKRCFRKEDRRTGSIIIVITLSFETHTVPLFSAIGGLQQPFSRVVIFLLTPALFPWSQAVEDFWARMLLYNHRPVSSRPSQHPGRRRAFHVVF